MPYYWTNKSFMKAHLIEDPIDDQPPQPIRIPGRKMAENLSLIHISEPTRH